MHLLKTALLLALGLGTAACIQIDNAFTGLPPGPWRGELLLENLPGETKTLEEGVEMRFQEVTQGELPFNFEVTYTDDTTFYLEFINGEERIRVDDIVMGLDRSTARDTLIITFPAYGTYIKGEFEENVINGVWVDPSRGKDYEIPLTARFGEDHRFSRLRKTPVLDVSGRWEVTFGIDREERETAIGEFEQDGNELRGTFRTETGDYRFLEGTVQADKLYLSCFDGTHAYLFEAKILPDSSLLGVYRSGTHYKTLWEARRKEAITLSDPFQRTSAIEGAKLDALRFPAPDGRFLGPADLEGPVKLIQILGTWCPNCLDETRFLRDYLTEHPERSNSVLGVAFERYPDSARAMEQLQRYRENLDLPYPLTLGGKASQAEASRAFPMLDEIRAFPTLLVLDGENRIRHIHTGFSGPATDQYAEFSAAFHEIVTKLFREADKEL